MKIKKEEKNWQKQNIIVEHIIFYHPSRRSRRAFGAEGSLSPKATIPATTPVKIDATAAQVETIIARPCFRPLVCITEKINII